MIPTTCGERRARGRRTWDLLSPASPAMTAGRLAGVALEHLDVDDGWPPLTLFVARRIA